VTRLPPDRREVQPSRRATGERKSPSFGPALNVSVPISFGLPLIVVAIALVVAAAHSGSVVLWIAGAVSGVLGLVLFASGKRL
jgi:O-antigen ligase